MMTSGEVAGAFELTYIVLNHIYFIVTRYITIETEQNNDLNLLQLIRGGNEYFEKDFKHFYCKIDEPTYIKYIKLDILRNVASEQNLGDILNELR